jgi:hypothetical protein
MMLAVAVLEDAEVSGANAYGNNPCEASQVAAVGSGREDF